MTLSSAAAATPRPGLWERLRPDLDLTRELAITQFKLKYTGSVLGYLWTLLKPILVFGMTYIIFDLVLHAGAGTENFPMQLLLGIVIWTFFAESTSVSVTAVVAQGNLIKKTYFPRLIPVVAVTLTALMSFAINLALFLVIAGGFGRLSIGAQSLTLLPLLVEIYLLTVGISLALGGLFVYYRDLGYIWEVLSQLLFYASGVIFPITIAKDQWKLKLLASNPIAQVVEDARHAVVAQGPSVPWASNLLGGELAAIPFVLCAGTFVIGLLIFRACSPRFAEYL